MKDIFALIHSNNYENKVKDTFNKLQVLQYDTTVLARSGEVELKDYQKTCYDTYHDVVGSIRDTLSELKRDYDAKTDATTVIAAVKKDFENNVISKWKYINDNSDKFVRQMFIDSTSERIYNYNAAMEVLLLLQKCCKFFLDNKELDSKEKMLLMNKIYNKCTEYSKDSLFDESAGSPMHCMGYTDITNIYDITNAYGIIVNAISDDSITDTLKAYSNKVTNLEFEANTLDTLMEKNISKAEAIDNITLNQYKDIFKKAMALKSIQRASIVMVGLLSKMQHTVNNLLINAKNSITSEPLKNVTHDMGMVMNPLIIEEQPIAIENLLSRMIDRIKTAVKDSGIPDIQKYKSVDSFMEFIEKHLDPDDIKSYLSQKKWRSLPLEDIIKGAEKLEKVIKNQENFVIKFCRAATFQQVFAYPDKKQLNIPEIMELYNVSKELGNDTTICYTDRFTGDFFAGKSPDKIDNLIQDENFNLYVEYKQINFPLFVGYSRDPEKFVRVKNISGKQIGVTSLEDLKKLQDLANHHGEYLDKEILTDAPTSDDINKNLSAIRDPEYRDTAVINYYRGVLWYDYYSLILNMYAWCTYMAYTIIKDVKKYA